MNLYLLRRRDYDYDEFDAHLVRASCEQRARVIAAKAVSQNEDRNEWLDAAKSTCVCVTADGEEQVILSSFNAG